MTKQSAIFGGLALIASVVAIYLFVQLRHERELNAQAQRIARPEPQLAPSASPPPPSAVVQAVTLPRVAEATAALPPPATPPVPLTIPIPIAYSPEFDRIFKSPRPERIDKYLVKMHTNMEAEPRDPGWAADTEREWRETYASNLELLRYGSLTVECRSTYCEIRMVANGMSEEELDKAMSQPLAARDFSARKGVNTLMHSSDSRNGTAAFVMTVRHKRAPPGADVQPSVPGGALPPQLGGAFPPR